MCVCVCDAAHLCAGRPQSLPVKTGQYGDENLGFIRDLIVLGQLSVFGVQRKGLVGDLAGLDGAREEVEI